MEANALYSMSGDRNIKDIFQQGNELTSPFLEFYRHHRQNHIWREFEHIVQHPISGIYVFPSLKSLQIWHGVLFVNAGLYAEGIFHFLIILDDEYPHSIPAVRFISKLIHPKVTKKGTLDIPFAPSTEGNGKIWNVLEYIRVCFNDADDQDAYISNIPYSINEGSKDYTALIRGCVLESLYEFQEQELMDFRTDFETGNPFDTNLLPDKSYQLIKQNMLKQCKPKNEKWDVLCWTKTAFGKVWDNLSHLSPDLFNIAKDLSNGASPQENSSQEPTPGF